MPTCSKNDMFLTVFQIFLFENIGKDNKSRIHDYFAGVTFANDALI
jgi:hypothetical protein